MGAPNVQSSDYETWVPSDGRHSTSCLLGSRTVYTRRKRDSECFNGESFDRPIDKRICECTPDDFECDVGFTRGLASVECKPVLGRELQDLDSDAMAKCQSGDVYYVSAYRKVPGNTCIDGWNPEKVAVSCPYRSRLTLSGRMALWCLIVAALILLLTSLHSKQKIAFAGVQGFANVAYASLSRANDANLDMKGFIDDEEDNADAPQVVANEYGTATSRTAARNLYSNGHKRDELDLL